jgi:hypothetical protein
VVRALETHYELKKNASRRYFRGSFRRSFIF